MDQKERSQLLVQGAAQLGVLLSDEQVETFHLYLQELNEWRKHINLFSRTDDREIILKDFLDSLTLLKHLPQGASVADIGSGAGFPGIPLKIARPDLKVWLLESNQKKVFFLKNLVRVLGLADVEIRRAGKGNGPKADTTSEFDVVVSRAFGSLQKLSSVGNPLLRKGGILLSMKGKKGGEELEESLPALERMGWELDFREQIRLPFLHHERLLIGLRKR
jgi:16S rRNA (guanine527-N7)-methyltransferase